MRSFVPKFRRHLILFSWKTSGCKLLEASVHFCEWSSDIVLYGHLCLKSVTKALKQLNQCPTNLKEKWVPIWARSKHWNLCSQLFKFALACLSPLSTFVAFVSPADVSFAPLRSSFDPFLRLKQMANGQWTVEGSIEMAHVLDREPLMQVSMSGKNIHASWMSVAKLVSNSQPPTLVEL